MSSIKNGKIWKRSCKSFELIRYNGIKYFVKRKNIRRNIMKLEENYKYTRNKIKIINKFLLYNVKLTY